jgi:hypothetical protein
MRDFFIKSLEMLVNVIVVIMAIGILIVAGMVAFGGNGMMGPGGQPMGGVGMGLLILIGGGLYLILVAGFMYLGIGIYQNTKRTADLLEQRG